MTLMVANSANAGAFSPFAPTGIIANGLIARQGLTMDTWTQVYLPSLLVQSCIALLGYLSFGGLRLWHGGSADQAPLCTAPAARPAPLTGVQWATVGAIAALIVGVLIFNADLGLLTITLAVLLVLVGAADQDAALNAVPWDTILMVCGVSMLVRSWSAPEVSICSHRCWRACPLHGTCQASSRPSWEWSRPTQPPQG